MKMKRTLTLLGVGVITSIILSTPVIASEIASELKSDATVNFVQDVEGIPPVLDPEELEALPEEEIPDGTVNNNPGLLTLDYVSNISFGKQAISATEKTYKSTTLQPFIQITDIRGTGEGWNVHASIDEFSKVNGDETTDEEAFLKGATITFNGGDVATNGNGISPQLSGSPDEPIVLSTDETITQVVSAEQNEGMGTWVTRWLAEEGSQENQKVKLTLPPGTATTDTYTATITWSLTSGPIAEETPE